MNDVVLPPWCDGNPRLFILIHRQALESDHVTEYIPEWIDLVFGFKQTGEAAVKAVNVFHPAVSVQGSIYSQEFFAPILQTLRPSPSSVGSSQGFRTKGCWFTFQYSFRWLMIFILIGFIPLSLLSIVSTMVMCESSQWLRKNIVHSTC